MILDFEASAHALIEAGKTLHGLGFVPATSGNLSARISDEEIAITVSGRHKGRLHVEDIMRVNLEGKSLDGKKPSAETLLHCQIYRRLGSVHSVLHPHSPAATALSRGLGSTVSLKHYELLKALPNIKTHATEVTVPIFDNDQDIARLASRVDHYLDHHADCPAYLIRAHGLYTWGASVDDALRHIEALEFLFNQELIAIRTFGHDPARHLS
jgi:methylthioribulose-1-phosphate dehydratase